MAGHSGNLLQMLHTPKKMSQGPTLFSCGIMENDRWRDLDRKCPLQIDQPSTSIWECLPEKDNSLWHREAVTACAVTSLIKDLSISDHNGNPSAPPSKRQCRSLSFSDEMSSCRTSWRPLGSKVWTPVEKRRCYSGGSVQRYSNGFSTMQRSSSFSLPSRANVLSSPCDQAGLHHRFGGQPCQGVPGSAPCGQAGDTWNPDPHPMGGGRLDLQRSLSCSHEQFSFVEYCPPSANSTPASTPELARRSSGLSRSRSQPCVLNDKKVGVKRRRPEEVQEQRPSLDLAKMAQVRAPASWSHLGAHWSLCWVWAVLDKHRTPVSEIPRSGLVSLFLKILFKERLFPVGFLKAFISFYLQPNIPFHCECSARGTRAGGWGEVGCWWADSLDQTLVFPSGPSLKPSLPGSRPCSCCKKRLHTLGFSVPWILLVLRSGVWVMVSES
ncbi:protein FAM53B isoform X2 [Papio anubis]|uniref:protein FAM53B isoform X2 n=1 Tax=Papio anubis TaxID=9555 RepID=UPI0004F20979|nr:protein FAM53B isoform X2 [Papio anubis]